MVLKNDEILLERNWNRSLPYPMKEIPWSIDSSSLWEKVLRHWPLRNSASPLTSVPTTKVRGEKHALIRGTRFSWGLL